MGKRIRLYDEEVKQLGLEPKPHDPGRSNARYSLNDEQVATLEKIRGYKKIKRLFFDIETSPMQVYTWRTGYKINIPYDNIIEDWKIICISYKWEGSDKVHTLTWDENQCDKQLLIDFIKIANTADEIVAHNGDRFDIKKIRTRCIYHRVPMFPKYRSLDTLKKARGGFAFNSNRLDYMAKFLGVGAKLEHEGFPMWVKCLQGDKQALADMVKYCEMDIVVLEDVFLTMQNYMLNNTHAGVIHGGYKHECPNCGNQDTTLLKNNFTPKGTIKRLMECDACEYTYEISNSAYRTMLQMKSKASMI